MKFIILPTYKHYKEHIKHILQSFENHGTLVGNGNRNTIKYFTVNDFVFNIKSFQQPNIVNRMVYKYFRKSKARRSFEFGNILISKGFQTPKPIAYIENHRWYGMTSSYYICEHLSEIATMREVITDHSFPDRNAIIKGYTHYFFRLHQEGIEFVDNSSANILVKKQDGKYMYYLVDLNRMTFYNKMQWKTRLHNFGRLTADKEVLQLISAEYAALTNASVEHVYTEIEKAAEAFRLNFNTKRHFKNFIKF